MEYGTLLDIYDFNKENIYLLINTYFDDPYMFKIKDIEKQSIYATKIQCLLGNVYRYLFVIIDKDINPINSRMKLTDLKWVSFQTRTLDDIYNIPTHTYKPKNNNEFTSLIELTEKKEEHTEYICKQFGIIITLLHTKKGGYKYQDRGTLCAALETYNTVLTFQNS